MTSPLVTRTAVLCRSTFARPALFNAVRFTSSEAKDVQHLTREPVVSVENLSGAPGKNNRNNDSNKLIFFFKRLFWTVLFVFLNLLVPLLNKVKTVPNSGASTLTFWKMVIVGKTLLWVGLLGRLTKKKKKDLEKDNSHLLISSDYQQSLSLKFFNKEDAIRFAEKQG